MVQCADFLTGEITMLKKSSVLCIVFIAAALWPLRPATAATVYTYTGNPLNLCAGPGCLPPPYPLITGSFTIGSPVGAGLTYGPITPLSYEITDGDTLLTNTTPDVVLSDLDVATNGSGAITEWGFQVQIEGSASLSADIYTSANIPTCNVDCAGEDASFVETNPSGSPVVLDNNGNADNPGTWTSSSVSSTTPEPRALRCSAAASR
jgi:hypothetical protein